MGRIGNFSQSRLRCPGRYGEDSRLLTMPSRPCCSAASYNICPSSYVGGTCQATSSSPSASSRSRRSASGRAQRSSPSYRRRSKAIRVTGFFSASRRARLASRTCIRSARAPKDGTPSPRATTSPSSRKSSPSVGKGVQLGEGDGDIVLVARPDAESALGAVHEDAHAVPLHLVGPARTGHVVALGGEHRQHTAHPSRRSSASSAPHHLRGILITCVQSGRVPSPSAWSASR